VKLLGKDRHWHLFRKKYIRFRLPPYTNITSRWIQELNVKNNNVGNIGAGVGWGE
jgi:hypothetical protein